MHDVRGQNEIMNILEQIVAFKKEEVSRQKTAVKIRQLEKSDVFSRDTFSLKKFLVDPDLTGIIAEFKRRSPSKGVINDHSDVKAVTSAYTNNGASGLSVLTDRNFFGGSPNDLLAARINPIPILRKDFMLDEYQVVEAKSIGADVILLIAACLSPKEVKDLARAARNLGLEVLLEIHDESETGHICDDIDIVGVNNRNLKTFVVNLEQSVKLAASIGNDKLKIAESGIHSMEDVSYLKRHGFDGFLIGEYFMKQTDPGVAFGNFVKGLHQS